MDPDFSTIEPNEDETSDTVPFQADRSPTSLAKRRREHDRRSRSRNIKGFLRYASYVFLIGLATGTATAISAHSQGIASPTSVGLIIRALIGPLIGAMLGLGLVIKFIVMPVDNFGAATAVRTEANVGDSGQWSHEAKLLLFAGLALSPVGAVFGSQASMEDNVRAAIFNSSIIGAAIGAGLVLALIAWQYVRSKRAA